MRNPLFLKTLAIGFVLLLIWVPLTMIGTIVHERQQRQQEAAREIGASYATQQRLLGPVLVIPYRETYFSEEAVTDAKGNRTQKQIEQRVDHQRFVFPTKLAVSGNLAAFTKRRGIFRSPVYEWQADLGGNFQIPDLQPVERVRPDSHLAWGKPFIAISLSDMRGVSGSPALQWGTQTVGFEKGSGLDFSENGMHAVLPGALPAKGETVAFSLKLGLRGTVGLGIVPIGESNAIQLSSAWPHPSFGGRFLPDAQTQSVGPEGFRAQWNISALASAATQQFLRAAQSDDKHCGNASCLESIEVRLVEPINVYTQSDRALKYGFLFVGITFAAFFLFELLRRLRIHPAQYFLVGLSQALFFLLVLSLSEHLAFHLAYLAAAGSSVGLIAFYLAHVMQHRWRGLGFGGVLGLLYGALYGLLISEDIALMLGSLLLFLLLALTMILTRRLDWYQIGRTET